LRNYENRFNHWALDWRLGLDVVDLALGNELDYSKWHDCSTALINSFADGFGSQLRIERDVIEGLPVIISPEGDGSAVVIGHPLWRHEESSWNSLVRKVAADLRSRGLTQVRASDPYVLDRTPIKIFSALLEGSHLV